MKEFLKQRLGANHRRLLKNFIHDCKSLFFLNNLNKLAAIYETDKNGEHFYTPHYQFHCQPYKDKKINLLEIGIGGYDDPLKGGNSLRMWKRFFSKSQIYGLDIIDKKALAESRIKIFTGSQTNTTVLQKLHDDAGGFDIIIDDGSHVNEHVITTFEYLFPILNNDGLYVIEDTQTAYWPEYGGSSEEMEKEQNMIAYFKKYIHGINHAEYLLDGYTPNYFDLHIVSIHFYHNLIFIKKGLNNEPTNYWKNKARNS